MINIKQSFLALSMAALFAAPAMAVEYRVGVNGLLVIQDPVVVQSLTDDTKEGVGFVTITNSGKEADALLDVAAPTVAEMVQIHDMRMENGVMKMRPAHGGVPISAGETVTLAPDGTHLMFKGLKHAFQENTKFPGILTFEYAGKVNVEFVVQSLPTENTEDGE